MLEFETKMLFIITGPGGNTVTMVSSIIAKAAREPDILTTGIVTMPFLFQGHRMIQADEGLSAFKNRLTLF